MRTSHRSDTAILRACTIHLPVHTGCFVFFLCPWQVLMSSYATTAHFIEFFSTKKLSFCETHSNLQVLRVYVYSITSTFRAITIRCITVYISSPTSHGNKYHNTRAGRSHNHTGVRTFPLNWLWCSRRRCRCRSCSRGCHGRARRRC